MKQSDSEQFGVELARMCSRHGVTLSKSDIKMYFGDLRDWTLNDIVWAFEKHRKDPERGMFFPQPAHLMKYLGGRPRDPALGVWETNPRTGAWYLKQDATQPAIEDKRDGEEGPGRREFVAMLNQLRKTVTPQRKAYRMSQEDVDEMTRLEAELDENAKGRDDQ